jgi:hypothetical protein
MSYSYQKEFHEALARTDKLGFITPKWSFKDRILHSNDSIRKVSNILNKFLGSQEMSYEDLAGQCIFVHTGISELITTEIDYNSLITIGWFHDEKINESFYKFTEEEFKYFVGNKPGIFQGFDVHVWITLDSGEIIDFTLLTTIGEINGNFAPGTILMCRPEESECFIKYHPMVVGRDAALKAFAYLF